MKISELYGKRVISTAGKEGYVISVNATGGKILCLVCADEGEREFTVDFKNILAFGESVIYEDRQSVLAASVPVRLGRAGFDERGNYLGQLEDFTFKGEKLKSAKIGKKNYPAEGLILGDIVIVKDMKRLKKDVEKEGRLLFKKGTFVTEDVLLEAAASGEYVQTTLKTL